MEHKVKTHPIFKIWLILLILIGISKISFIIFSYDEYVAELPATVPNNYEFLSLFSNSAIVFCFLMLLKLKKVAFYGVVLISILSVIISLTFKFSWINLSFVVIALGILIGVMQIKRNNVSAWQALH